MKKILTPMTILFTTAFLLMACSDDNNQNENSDKADPSENTSAFQSEISNHTEESSQTDKKGDNSESASESGKTGIEDSNETSSKGNDSQNQKEVNKDKESADRDELANDDNKSEPENKKKEYLKKLNDAKKEMEEKREHPIDGTTFAMKKVEGDLYDVWDGFLNEVYDVLEEQLPPEEMEQLRQEQRKWIDYRDNTAKEASLKFKGGTMEQLEYVMVQNNLTVERCFELVEDYME